MAPRTKPPWAGKPDYLDGYSKIDLPSEKLLRLYWDVDILDPEKEPSHKIIDAGDSFTVLFRVALVGDLWACVCADWWFDVGFVPIGEGKGFDLSDLVGKDKFWVKGWEGCATRYIELPVVVPKNTIPVDYCGTLYECGGKFQMYCCEVPAPVVGFEPLEERLFFKSPLEDE